MTAPDLTNVPIAAHAQILTTVVDRSTHLRTVRKWYDWADKIMIAFSIVFGAATTISAGLNQQAVAVWFAALTTATISAQHWFALGPRVQNIDSARVRLTLLRLRLETQQIKSEDAIQEYEDIEKTYIGEKPIIGTAA